MHDLLMELQRLAELPDDVAKRLPPDPPEVTRGPAPCTLCPVPHLCPAPAAQSGLDSLGLLVTGKQAGRGDGAQVQGTQPSTLTQGLSPPRVNVCKVSPAAAEVCPQCYRVEYEQ